MKKPNVLFIMTDQQRWDCVGANGNRVIQTPNLDALARDGVNFSHSFTCAMACVPSRACIMTGQHVTAHGVRSTAGSQWLRPGTPTLPGVFRDHGYHTVSVGKNYYGNISLIDDWVGRLLDGLKRKGLYEDTLVVFTSDHGEYLGDHTLYYKGFFPCDSDTRVPLILKVPGMESGTCAELVGNVSLMPTLLDLCGLPVTDTVQGRSLKKLMEGVEPGGEAVLTYSESGPAWRIRTREWAYIFREGQGHDQLYNLVEDPHELVNLAESPQYAAPRNRMLRLLFNHLASPPTPSFRVPVRSAIFSSS